MCIWMAMGRGRNKYIHTLPRPYTRFKKLNIIHTHTYTSSIQKFLIKIETETILVGTDSFIIPKLDNFENFN